MAKKIKEIYNIDLALEFIERSYLETIKDEDTYEGQKTFIFDYLYGKTTYEQFESGYMKIYGYYEDDLLIGLVSLDDLNYIKFLFVDRFYLGLNIGTKLFNFALEKSNKNIGKITLDSSLSSYNFYKKLGFIQTSEVVKYKDMNYIPMEYVF